MKLRFTTLLLLAAVASARAQELPQAPSAVIEAQYPQYAHGTVPAGSGKIFTSSATVINGMRVEQSLDSPLPLSIDDAVAYGLAHNTRLTYDRANSRIVRGDLLQVGNALVPGLALDASSSAQEINLAAMGFKPGSIKIPGFNGTIPNIVKVNVTQALLTLNQTLFSLPAFELYRGAREEATVVRLNSEGAIGDFEQAVIIAYLQVLADQASLANAQSNETAAHKFFDDASARRDAGVGTNLDALRGQVEFQNRVQQRASAEGTLGKDLVQLNRVMGLPAGQKLLLTDSAPLADLADLDVDRALTVAYTRRRDLLTLGAQIRVADRERRAIKFARLPTVGVSGFYGVQGVTDGSYHGIFRAVGSLNFPIFREAAQRGEEEIISAQLTSLRQREADMRGNIEAQIRSSILDVQSSHELVRVAQSNVALAQAELSDERDRFTAGIDTSLPVVDAQATLAGSQAQLVKALYQFNTAKIRLARNTGIIDSQYRTYLGTNVAASPVAIVPAGD